MQSKKNIMWNAFGNIIYLGCQWLVTVLVTRWFGYEDAGILSLAMSISALFQTIALFGIRNYQVSDVKQKYSDSTYIGFRGITCIFSMVLCLFFSAFNFYSDKQMWAITLFMMFRLAENYSDVLHGVAQKKNRLDIAGKAFSIKGIVILVLFILGYWFSKNLIFSLLLMTIGSCVTTIFYDLISVKKISHFKLTDKFQKYYALALETLPLCIYMFLVSAISTIPKYILEKMCDAVELGAYSSIFAPALLIQAAASYIYGPFATTFAEYYHCKETSRFVKLLKQLVIVIMGIAIVIILLGIVFGEWALNFLFGKEIIEHTYLLLPILVSTFAMSYLAFFCMLEVVVRDFKGLIGGCLIGVLLTIVMTPSAIKMCGTNGASYGLIIGVLGAVLCLFIRLYYRLKGEKNYAY